MVKKIALASCVVSILAGCSLFGEYAPAEEKGYFEPKSAATQDPYWQRFYELEREIAQLKAHMNQPVAQQASSAASTQSAAQQFLEKLRQKTDRALSTIDQAIASIDSLPQKPAEEADLIVQTHMPEPMQAVDYGVAEISPQVAVAGSLHRNTEGAVVEQVTYSQSRQPRYKYSLVYVYPEAQPWNEMWDRLEAANEQDKWRGSNPEKPSYFIYVGAYLREIDAMKRHDTLATILGEGPEMRTNVQSTALAAK